LVNFINSIYCLNLGIPEIGRAVQAEMPIDPCEMTASICNEGVTITRTDEEIQLLGLSELNNCIALSI
jgi:hypothetical protein